MHKKVIGPLAIALLFTVTGLYAEDDCKGLNELLAARRQEARHQPNNEFLRSLVTWMNADKADTVDCSSVTSVFAKVIHDNQTSGKRLEKEKPFDAKEAEANLSTALADPAIQARLNKLQQAVPDENARLFLEAAIFDEEGYYSARELRVRQLLEKMK
jgi:hypothetical protein